MAAAHLALVTQSPPSSLEEETIPGRHPSKKAVFTRGLSRGEEVDADGREGPGVDGFSKIELPGQALTRSECMIFVSDQSKMRAWLRAHFLERASCIAHAFQLRVWTRETGKGARAFSVYGGRYCAGSSWDLLPHRTCIYIEVLASCPT